MCVAARWSQVLLKRVQEEQQPVKLRDLMLPEQSPVYLEHMAQFEATCRQQDRAAESGC